MTTIHLVVFENLLLTSADLQESVDAAEREHGLSHKGFRLEVPPPTQVTSLDSFLKCVDDAQGQQGEARIVFVDLNLLGPGLTEDVTLELYRNAVPAKLHLDEDDSTTAGGFLLAWHVLR